MYSEYQYSVTQTEGAGGTTRIPGIACTPRCLCGIKGLSLGVDRTCSQTTSVGQSRQSYTTAMPKIIASTPDASFNLRFIGKVIGCPFPVASPHLWHPARYAPSVNQRGVIS